MVVMVLGKKFKIQVMEEGTVGDDRGVRCCGGCNVWREAASSKGSIDGGSVLAVGLEEDCSDGDWSECGQVLLGMGRLDDSTRLKGTNDRNET
jgi:hypothetical protein